MHALVGQCVNFLPLRLAISGEQSFAELLSTTAGVVLDAFEHQTLTYGSLLKKLPERRDPSRLPLVSATFNLDSAMGDESELFTGLRAQVSAVPRHFDNFELFVNAVPVGGGLRLECQYNTALFDESTVRRWLALYESLLRSAVQQAARPLCRIGGLPAHELAALRALQPAPVAWPGPASMHGLVQQQCLATPESIALVFGTQTLSYRALEAQSNRLARLLRERGIARGDRVGLCFNRGLEMMVALLAVLKAGAAYVPLDPGFPQARLDYYAEDAKLALLLTDGATAATPRGWHAEAEQRTLRVDLAALESSASGEALAPSPLDAQPEDAAYVIYTSGSTGKPKGVCLPHRGVVNFLRSMAIEPGIAAGDVLTAVTTLSFDIAVFELILPLTVGAQIVIAPRETAMDGNQLAGLVESSGTTVMFATPGMWRMLQDADWRGRPGFRALVGGEALPVDLARFLLSRSAQLWNMYGPTETTICSTMWPVNAAALERSGVAIGKPVANTTVWVVDEHGEPCPIGVMGELWIGGSGVATHYLDRPELTAERFVSTPPALGQGLCYRTGDRGRWRSDGLLEHGGRLDLQVKVRGYRIELGEIEACCNESASVGESVAAVREDEPGDARLVVYVTAASGATFDEAALQQTMRARLPEYMVPQHVVLLDRIPRLPNGKVDRQALPAPDRSSRLDKRQRVAPRTELEETVLGCMEQVLNLPGLGIHDDFFALGGHSLLAARLTTQLNRLFDVNLRLPTLFESPTVERLALAIEARLAQETPRREPITVVPNRRTARLSPMQERVRFVQELHPDRVLYNAPSAHRLTGAMDLPKFEQALRVIIDRQASLRTYVGFDEASGEHVQVIAESVEVSLTVEDLSALDAPEREAELFRRMRAVVDTPFDIHRPPLFRSGLYKLAADQHVFVFVPHHLIWDGWSFDLLYEEFSVIYGALVQGEAHRLPPLAISYGDYAEWYLRWLAGPECAAQLGFWKSRFAGAPAVVAPRTDRPRRAGMSGAGGTEWVSIDKALTAQLRQLARQHDVTTNMLTFALYATMIAGVINTPSVVIAVPVRGRLSAELEPVMGYLNNLLAVQVHADADKRLADFAVYAKQQLLEVMNHQDVPFELVAALPEVANRAQGVGLYQALFSFQDVRERQRDWGGLRHQMIQIFQKGATDDLGFWLLDTPDTMEGGFIYNADIYEASTAQAFAIRFLEIARLAAANPATTLRELMSADGSPSAQLLKRLAHDGAPLPPSATPAPANAESASQPVAAPDAKGSPDAAPMSEDEAAIAKVWAGLLGIDSSRLRSTDNFFDVGGDSLLAMRAVEQSAAALGFRVDARRYVFESLGQLATRNAAGSTTPAAPGNSGLFGRVLSAWRRKA